MKTADRLRQILRLHQQPLYQTHTHRGQVLLPGIRGLDRRQLIRPEDLAGRTVLDLGCATGAESLWAAEQGAAGVLGLECDAAMIATFRAMAAALKLRTTVTCRQWDLRAGLPPDLPAHETILALAITQYCGYRALWQEVPGATVVYCEGGADSPYSAASLSGDGWRAELLGRTAASATDPRLLRPFFRLTRT